MKRRQFLISSAAFTVALAGALPAFAEWKPKRPVNAIVPYDAGGGTDSIARAIAASMSEALPVPVVVVNKPGASGVVGATAVANAKADGSTILITSGGSFVLNSVMKDLEVDPFDDFITIGQIGDLTTSLMVPVSSPFQTIDDLVKAAKAAPGSLRWAHTGRGSFHHVAGQGFLNSAELSAVDVAFKGGSATRAAVIGGQVDFGMIGIQQLSGFTDQLRPLALVSNERDMFSPDVPTFEELGLNVPLISSPIVVFAPKDTPDDVVAALQDAVKTAADSASFKELMSNGNNAPSYLSGADASQKLLQMQDDARAIVSKLN
ncbi:Bug family tripartite tricarboxylate transporter substrate binding protein [Roseibium sediminis]|uniref:Bug family tripartite tricarboxylate transporter substrate binding protein n=1 Tax=Roseibium sediminis TaxID=1775174 RepID=UPI00123D4497|nr:tripartite tricarboxylate transporter substrate binding protein [Roseibium sediminis]